MVIVIDKTFGPQIQTDDVASFRLDARPGLECLVVEWKGGDTTYFESCSPCDVVAAYALILEAQ
ncbi:hypothetical protein PS903_02014 [Pseudomonas fluorescens]|nr:hypothetical protein PS903_02014 [Pseudomonas fluorescens]